MPDSSHDAADALQHAALRTIDAMRGLLDAAEELVADPRHLQDVVSGVSEWAERMSTTINGDQPADGRADAADATEGSGFDDGGDGPPGADDSDRLRRIPLD